MSHFQAISLQTLVLKRAVVFSHTPTNRLLSMLFLLRFQQPQERTEVSGFLCFSRVTKCLVGNRDRSHSARAASISLIQDFHPLQGPKSRRLRTDTLGSTADVWEPKFCCHSFTHPGAKDTDWGMAKQLFLAVFNTWVKAEGPILSH